MSRKISYSELVHYDCVSRVVSAVAENGENHTYMEYRDLKKSDRLDQSNRTVSHLREYDEEDLFLIDESPFDCVNEYLFNVSKNEVFPTSHGTYVSRRHYNEYIETRDLLDVLLTALKYKNVEVKRIFGDKNDVVISFGFGSTNVNVSSLKNNKTYFKSTVSRCAGARKAKSLPKSPGIGASKSLV